MSRFAIVVLAALLSSLSVVHAQDPWVLTNEQRREFLHYYSPVILKQADENNRRGKNRGHDRITNFDFDKDGIFSNNRDHWHNEKHKFIDNTHYSDWEINPTLYTALIEFWQNGQKSLILLFHVYHAMQRGDIHDWERMEVRINNVKSRPSDDDDIMYYVLTAHRKHTGRLFGHSDLHYVDGMATSNTVSGKHLLVWQARWNGHWPDSRQGELRFVEDGLSDFQEGNAKVDVSGHGNKRFHYVFVDRDAKDTREFWNARQLTNHNASDLASVFDDEHTIPTSRTKRITYQLQDLADVFPTHYIHANGTDMNNNWGKKTSRVNLVNPINSAVTGETITVPAGIQSFFRTSREGSGFGDREGYPNKHWFWGAYYWGRKGNWIKKAYEGRAELWGQHDYFAHDGGRGRKKKVRFESGQWLPSCWHESANGGFDGRWVQLFSP